MEVLSRVNEHCGNISSHLRSYKRASLVGRVLCEQCARLVSFLTLTYLENEEKRYFDRLGTFKRVNEG